MAPMTFLAIALSGPCIAAAIRWARQPLVCLIPWVLAVTFAVVDLPPPLEWAVLLVVTAALVSVALATRQAARRAYLANDGDASLRHGRVGYLLTGQKQSLTFADMGAWRGVAVTDHAAARPHLERAANRDSWSQPFPQLVFEAAYGDADVPALAEAAMQQAPKKVRPLLLHLAIAQLVQAGRTNDALSMFSRAAPADLTPMTRPLILIELAAATGDLDTLEALLATGSPFLDPERPEICRATAERARGEVQQGDERLRAIDVPPAGRAARSVALRLAPRSSRAPPRPRRPPGSRPLPRAGPDRRHRRPALMPAE